MSKKVIDNLVKAFEKDKSNKSDLKREINMDDFAIGFSSDDIQITTRNGTANVTAHIKKDEFDKILYTHGYYIIEYLKDKGFIK